MVEGRAALGFHASRKLRITGNYWELLGITKDFSLTEVYFLGFSWVFKEYVTENTQSVRRPGRSPGPESRGHFFWFGRKVMLFDFVWSQSYAFCYFVLFLGQANLR